MEQETPGDEIDPKLMSNLDFARNPNSEYDESIAAQGGFLIMIRRWR